MKGRGTGTDAKDRFSSPGSCHLGRRPSPPTPHYGLPGRQTLGPAQGAPLMFTTAAQSPQVLARGPHSPGVALAWWGQSWPVRCPRKQQPPLSNRGEEGGTRCMRQQFQERFLRHPKPLPLSAPWKGHQRPLLDGRVFGLNSLHLALPALGPSSLCPRRRVSSQGSGAQGKAVEHKTLAFQPQHPFPPSLLLRVSPSSHRCQTELHILPSTRPGLLRGAQLYRGANFTL